MILVFYMCVCVCVCMCRSDCRLPLWMLQHLFTYTCNQWYSCVPLKANFEERSVQKLWRKKPMHFWTIKTQELLEQESSQLRVASYQCNWPKTTALSNLPQSWFYPLHLSNGNCIFHLKIANCPEIFDLVPVVSQLRRNLGCSHPHLALPLAQMAAAVSSTLV